MNRILRKILMPLVEELVQEKIDKLIKVEPPLLDEIKLSKVKSGKSLSIWEAIERDSSDITLCIRYSDNDGLEDFVCYEVIDLADLRFLLNNFTAKHELFSSVSLHVGSKKSTSTLIENIVQDRDLVYSSSELSKVFKPLLDWINERPHLLI